MTTAEFHDWLDACHAMFPASQRQFAHAEPGAGRDNLGKAWFAIVSPFTPDEAYEALKRMLAGDEPEPAGFSEHSMPRMVAASCRAARRRAEERERANVVVRDHRGARRMAWEDNIPDIKRQLIECIAAGGDHEALADELMPIDDDLRRRVRCPDCLDDGMVTIWGRTSVDLARQGKLVPKSLGLYRSAIPCHCQAGERFSGKEDKRIARFHPGHFCKCDGFGQRDIDALYEWLQTPNNYEPAFDAFNAG